MIGLMDHFSAHYILTGCQFGFLVALSAGLTMTQHESTINA